VAGWRADLLRVAGWRAARHGLAHDLVHPVERVLAPPREVFAALLDHVDQHLVDADRTRVEELFDRVLVRGNGAVRQRRRFEETADLRAVVDDLADATEASWR
jgi:carboxylate-amine ligase